MSTRTRILEHIGVHRYWLVVLLPLLMPLAWSLRDVPGFSEWFAWLPTVVLFGILPLLDVMIGPDVAPRGQAAGDWYPRRLVPLLAAVVFAAVLAWSLWVFATHPHRFGWLAACGWALALGDLGGTVAINVAHELVHRRRRWERALGGLLLSLVGYGGFKIEHTRWHHVHVATERDPSSAPLGRTIYAQVPFAIWHNTRHAARLATAGAKQRGRPVPWLLNEFNGWMAVSMLVGVTVAVMLGGAALVLFIAQGLLAISLLEVINYIEHYGLRRGRQADGRYERPGPAHSWDADFWLSNSLLLALPRHADHHANPGRSFDALELADSAPRLPLGYASLVTLTLCPPLWRRLVHPRLPSPAVG